MTNYNRMVDDVGKGLQSLRRMHGSVVLANGTVEVVMDVIPVRHVIRKVWIGSPTATDITGEANVLALASTDDIDTAPAAGNRVIAAVTAFADKKMASPALSAFGAAVKDANTMYVLSVAHNAAVVGGEVSCIVEYDVVGENVAAYGGGQSAKGTYE